MMSSFRFFLTLSICFVFQVPASNESHGSEEKKSLGLKEYNIIQKFRGKGKVEMLDDIQIIKPKSSAHTDIVIFMKRKDACPLAAKVFNEINDYHDEKEALKKEMVYIKLVNDLRKNCHIPLPYITQYEGATQVAGQGIILLTKAEGISLEKLNESLLSMSDDRIIRIFKTIGEQLGNIDALFFKKNNQTRLSHPDSHFANFTFDETQNQLYWLDTAGLNVVKTFLPDLESNYNFVKQIEYYIIHNKNDEEYADLIDRVHLDETILMRVTIAKQFLALKNLYQGYTLALNNQGISNNNMDTFNQKISKNGSLGTDLEAINTKLEKMDLPKIPLS